MTIGPSANQPKAIRADRPVRLQPPSLRNRSKRVPSSQDYSGLPRLTRQMNEDGLDVREANHRVMKISDQGRPSAERLPLSAAPRFLG
jgi:hypothetical protein